MMKLKIALLQTDIAWEDKLANFAKAKTLILKAKRAGANIAVLPELFATGVTNKGARKLAESENGETVSFLKQIAKANKIGIIGSFIEKGTAKPRNCAVAIDSKGKLVAKYAKIHPFSYSKEHLFYEPGKKASVFNFAGVKCGLEICYDIRFPELTRKMALSGARIIFVPANFGAARVEHWDTLLKARAIENQLFVVGVNRVGSAPDSAFNGHSAAYDPWGMQMNEISEKESIRIVELYLGEVDKVRKRITCFKDRQPRAY